MTVYVPPDVTIIEGVVSAVDHIKFVPDVVKVEEPQSSTTDTTGALGTAMGTAIPDPLGLTQPLFDCVTVYVPLDDTLIEGVVSAVDQIKFDPDVIKVVEPQLLTTETTGAFGIAVIVMSCVDEFTQLPLVV